MDAASQPVAPVRRRRGRSVGAYFAALALVFGATVAAAALYESSSARSAAQSSARAAAGFGAGLAARDLEQGIAAARAQLAQLAATPGLSKVFGAAPSSCTLQFGGVGPFASGHLDLVSPAGDVACSSLHARPATSVYAGAPWLAAALRDPALEGPVRDPRTGTLDLVVAQPLGGAGVAALFLELGPAGPALTAADGGPQGLAFVVTTADRRTALVSSEDPARFVGRDISATAFARSSGTVRPGLGGGQRIFAGATVPGVGWHVYAGASRARALAPASSESRRELFVLLLGYVVFLAMLVLVYGAVARPLRRLRLAARGAPGGDGAGLADVGGPTEVRELAGQLALFQAASRRELESASRLAGIVESSSDAILAMSADATILAWNPGAEHLFGYTRDEIVGRSALVLVPESWLAESERLIVGLLGGEAVMPYDTVYLHKDGHEVEAAAAAAPIRDALGEVVGIAAVIRDTTERNRAERRRRELEGRLRQSERLESLGQLAAGIAHDFNNLLGVILNYSSFVGERVAADGQASSDVGRIREAAERAARLTRQLLIFGRREAVETELLDLDAVTRDAADLLRATVSEQVEVEFRLAGDLPAVLGDRSQLEQILLNLAVNARDAMPDGGVLTVETSLVALGEEGAELHPSLRPGRFVVLAVADTGTGIEPAVAERIFEPFFTTKPKGEGTGLGLATIHGIVTDYGGAVLVDSALGAGTTFRVYLPAAASPAGEHIPHGPATEDPGNGETVLVVEDEPAMLEVTARILRRGGYVVLEAASAEVAIELAEAHDFSLLLTDSVLPRVTGRQLTEEIAQVQPGRPVVYMSGYSEDALSRRRMLERGAVVVQKPFTAEHLLETVRSALGAGPSPA